MGALIALILGWGLHVSMDAHRACVEASSEISIIPRVQDVAFQHCLHRAYHATRFDRYRARDGSKIHDRDRPYAHRFYALAVRRGYLSPRMCKAHVAHAHVRHAATCEDLARTWPFKRPKMTPKLRAIWMAASHDYERFGTRGFLDLPAATFSRYLGSCVPPEILDDNYSSALAHGRRVAEICAKQNNRCTLQSVRDAW